MCRTRISKDMRYIENLTCTYNILLNLLNEFWKEIKCEACLINTIIQEHDWQIVLSYGIKITLKSHFGVKKFRICHYEHNYVLSVVNTQLNNINQVSVIID